MVTWTECPLKGNFNWRELSGAHAPPEIVENGPNPAKTSHEIQKILI